MASDITFPNGQAEEAPFDDEVAKDLKTICQRLDIEERSIRFALVKEWKRMELYWRGIHNIIWDEVAHDWRDVNTMDTTEIPAGVSLDDLKQTINIYRAHGEAIIAALSATVPVTRFFPADADNFNDIAAAQGFTKLVEKIQIDNDAPLKIVQILYNLYNFGICFAYNYHDEDPKYGVFKDPIIEVQEVPVPAAMCPQCGNMGPMETANSPCPMCQTMMIEGQSFEQKEVQTGVNEVPKAQERVEIYGPLHVRAPHNISSLRNTPYLCLDTELHYAIVQEMFPAFADKIRGGLDLARNDRWARNPLESGDSSSSLSTVSRWWLRPAAYNVLGVNERDNGISQIRALYPKGARVTFVDDEVVEIIEEVLDEHWTVSESPISMVLNSEPIGKGVAAIQEMRNDLDSLTMQTIRNGIPETFVDSATLDLEEYSKVPAEPGLVFPVKGRPGQPIDASFFTKPASTLSRDIPEFRTQLDSDAQLTSGAASPVWGGPNVGGSKTYGEYELRRNQALQRLSISWKIIVGMWTKLMEKCAESARATLSRDINFVKKSGGSFVNVWIRREELSGEIGRVESETSDQFPMTWAQIRDLLMNLIQMNNQPINAMIFHPENIEEFAKHIGWPNLYVPGSVDRNQQLAEIDQLTKGVMVQVDPLLDDHGIHIEIIKKWAKSLEGQDLKQTNPQAYQAVMMHFQAHNMVVQQQQMQMAMMQPPTGSGGNEPAPVPTL